MTKNTSISENKEFRNVSISSFIYNSLVTVSGLFLEKKIYVRAWLSSYPKIDNANLRCALWILKQ